MNELEYIRNCLKNARWKFAKTYANTFPHEYTVREWWNNDNDFVQVVKYIRKHGIKERFFRKFYTYLYLDGYKYWTMGAPIEETIIINRTEAK